MKGRRRVGGMVSLALLLWGVCSYSAELGIGNTTNEPASPRAGQDVFAETQTWPAGVGTNGYILYAIGTNWSGAWMANMGLVNSNDQWRGRIGRFSSGSHIQYLVGVEDIEGTNHYDDNGGGYYWFSVTNGDATTWIGGIYHSPTNGALGPTNSLWLNLFAAPSQTLVRAFADYSVNGWIWERVPLEFSQMDGSNEWWQAEIGLLPPGSTVWYAFDAEDGTGAIHIRPTSGLPYEALVSGTATDSDSDGLPDDWEQFWFGSLTNAVAGGNPDADGLSGLLLDNRMERVMGTDPADSNVVEDLQVLWKPSSPIQGGAIKLSLNEDPLEPLYVSVVSAIINQGPGLTNETKELRADLNGRFTNVFLLATNAAYCKINQLASENGTNDNRGIGWTIPVAAASGTADTDGDAMPDAWELANGLDPFVDAASGDEDDDELTNAEEYALGTNPWLLDTDGDGWSDGEEVLQSTDPLDRMDAPEIARGVVINEALYDPAGDDTGKEFVELYSSSPFDVDLSGFRLQGTLSSNPSNFLNIFTFPTGAVIRSGSALLVGGDLMAVQPDYVTNFALVNRSSGNQKTAGVRLITPSTMSPTTTVDALLYNYPNTYSLPTNGYGAVSATNIYATSSNSLARRLNGLDTDTVSDWIRTNNPTPISSITVCDSDGDGWSDAEEIQAETSPWDRLDAPRIARGVVINEALYDPNGTDDHKEWVELYCSSPLPVNLGGFSLRGTLSSNSGTNLTTFFTFPVGTLIQPGRHLLIGGTNAGVTPDFATNIALINRGQGDKTGGIYLTGTNSSAVTTRVDALLYSYPNTYNLPTNEFGFIDSTHLPPFANKSGESIARLQTGVDTDSISDWHATSNRTPTASSTFGDSDGDGLSDADEITGALNSYGESTDYLLADSDGDGLSDGNEIAAGTDPNNADTDGDGVLDQVEVVEAGSDPLSNDFNGRVREVWSTWGSAYTNFYGIWTNYATSAYAFSQGGTIFYSMTLATGGVYALTLEGTQFDGESTVNEFTLQLFVDDVLIGQKELHAVLGVQGETQWMMPWLSGGVPHEISIRWRYKKGNGSLRILRLVAEEWGGPDTDENGIMDWQDHRADTLLTATYWPTSCLVSPVCLEGRSREFGLLHAQIDYIPGELFPTSPVIRHGLGDGWVADVPLNPASNTQVQVDCDNGQESLTGSITWVEFNLLAPTTNRLILRKNDGLKWNLRPVSQSNGTVRVYTNGTLVHVSATNAPWINAFTNAGTYLVSGVWSNAGAVTYSSTVTVEVVDAFFAGNPVVWVGYARTWNCPNISTNVWVGFDQEVTATRTVAPTGATFTLRMGQAESHSAVARLGGTNGPVIATARVHGFSQLSTTDLGVDMYFYPDGTGRLDVSVLINSAEFPLDMDVYIALVGGGLTFAGGGTLMELDFDETGMATVTIYVAADSWAAFCHSLYVEQDGIRVGDR